MEQTKIQEILKDFVEKGAAIEHERWSRWQKYMHSKILPTEHDALMQIGTEFVERWNRQIDTPYAELSEKEKESDRIEVRKYYPFIDQIIDLAIAERNKQIVEMIENFGDIWKLEKTAEETESDHPKFVRVNRDIINLITNTNK